MERRDVGKPLIRPETVLVAARVVGATLAYVGVLLVLAGLVIFVGSQFGPGASRLLGLIGLGVAEAGALLTVLVLWRKLDRRPLAELGLSMRGALRLTLRGALLAVLMMGFVVGVSFILLGNSRVEPNPDPLMAGVALVVGLLAFAIQGPSEEVLFRGYILENVRARFGNVNGIVVSAVAFTLLHAANDNYGLLAMANLLLFGVATAVYRLWVDGGQLWGVFAIHAVWNWLQQVVFGLPNSGTAPPLDNTVVSLRPDESLPEVVWGGGFGPEGTLAATLVLLGLLAYGLRRRQPAVVQARTSA
jgi:CAAX protease family protein